MEISSHIGIPSLVNWIQMCLFLHPVISMQVLLLNYCVDVNSSYVYQSNCSATRLGRYRVAFFSAVVVKFPTFPMPIGFPLSYRSSAICVFGGRVCKSGPCCGFGPIVSAPSCNLERIVPSGSQHWGVCMAEEWWNAPLPCFFCFGVRLSSGITES